ncbi:MAG: cation:proton antiporter domain-containing protein [Pirellulales bacterium]
MNVTIITYLLIILAAGFVAGVLCKKIGVSILVGYLVVGALIGHGGLDWVSGENREIERLAEAGVLFLLFSIGLEFTLEELGRLGRYLFLGGSVQMVLVAAPVMALAMAWGMSWKPALLLGGAVAMSSTVLVFRALAEWGHTATPHGRRAVGILLFQDMMLVPLLLLIPFLTGQGAAAGPMEYVDLVLKSVVVIAGVLILRLVIEHWVVPMLAELRSLELVVLFVLTVLGGVPLAVYAAGIPPAVGAFGAGLVFGGNRLTAQVDALVLPFRESFAAVFFVSLGLLLQPQLLWQDLGFVTAGLAGILLLKSAAGALALRLTGLAWRPSLGTAIGLAQIGEFSFVLALQAWQANVLTDQAYNRFLILALGSIILTPLLVRYGLLWTEGSEADTRAAPGGLDLRAETIERAVVIGIGPVGRQVASRLEIAGFDVCLIDLSPVNLHQFAQQGFRTVAGDASDPDVLGRAEVDRADLVAICTPDDQVAVRIVKVVRHLSQRCRILVRCRYLATVGAAKKAGADLVVSEEAEASGALLRILAEFEERPAAPRAV